jgi:ubiquinone biosynthesis monooxygenase Coq7
MTLSPLDRWICGAEAALRTLSGGARSERPSPEPCSAVPLDGQGLLPDAPPPDDAGRRLSGALMRVNHVGEVCAQALYQAQALSTSDAHLREQMLQAAREEIDHLAWTETRLAELGAHRSVLNPLWYAGAFGIGLLAGRLGDRVSLGFVIETERQVEQHLAGHLDRLPEEDRASRAIVAQMKSDEAEHAAHAIAAGGVELPRPVKHLMRAAALVMTTTAHHV